MRQSTKLHLTFASPPAASSDSSHSAPTKTKGISPLPVGCHFLYQQNDNPFHGMTILLLNRSTRPSNASNVNSKPCNQARVGAGMKWGGPCKLVVDVEPCLAEMTRQSTKLLLAFAAALWLSEWLSSGPSFTIPTRTGVQKAKDRRNQHWRPWLVDCWVDEIPSSLACRQSARKQVWATHRCSVLRNDTCMLEGDNIGPQGPSDVMY